MINIKPQTRAITNAVNAFRTNVNGIAIDYAAKKKKAQDYAKSMDGKWTKDYQKQYVRENTPSHKTVQKKVDAERAKLKAVADLYLEQMSKSVQRYIDTPPSVNLMQYVSLVNTMGMELSYEEMESLARQAKSSADARLITALDDKRTNRNLAVEKPLFENMPDAKALQHGISEYRRGIFALLEYYCGDNAELLDCGLCDPSGKAISPEYAGASVDNHCGNERLVNEIDKANSVLPERKAFNDYKITSAEKEFFLSVCGLEPTKETVETAIRANDEILEIASRMPEWKELASKIELEMNEE